jgi:hypothetical protein
MKIVLYIFFTFTTFITFGQEQQRTYAKYEKGEKLEKHYSLDSIVAVEINNWKGNHFLSAKQIESFKKNLKTYIYGGKYARTKPGHLWCLVTFKNGTCLSFYSNSSANIIIQRPGEYHTFKTMDKVNFENY